MSEETTEAQVAMIEAATARFVATVNDLEGGALTGPSLCPGWTRGHVVAHVIRNAVALGNLLASAVSGEKIPMYTSMEARNAAIEAGSKHAKGILLSQVRAASRDFAVVARSVPAERWDVEVEWMSGRRAPARAVLAGRLREVEVHHVDLDAGYTPAHWDPAFVAAQLAEAAESMSGRDGVPEVVLASTDQGSWHVAGSGEAVTVSGPGAALLAWVTGRSSGDGLEATGGALPKLPGWP